MTDYPLPATAQRTSAWTAEVRRILTTWCFLVVVTVLTTWVLVVDQAHRWLLALTFALVAVKVVAVFDQLMEFRHAPRAGRLIFGGWAVALAAAIVVLAW